MLQRVKAKIDEQYEKATLASAYSTCKRLVQFTESKPQVSYRLIELVRGAGYVDNLDNCRLVIQAARILSEEFNYLSSHAVIRETADTDSQPVALISAAEFYAARRSEICIELPDGKLLWGDKLRERANVIYVINPKALDEINKAKRARTAKPKQRRCAIAI